MKFTFKDSNILINKLKIEMKSGPLSAISLILPDWENIVLSNCKYGIFTNDEIFINGNRDSLHGGDPEANKFLLSIDIVRRAEFELNRLASEKEKKYKFLNKNVMDSLIENQISVVVNEQYDVFVIQENDTDFLYNENAQITVGLTLPSAELLFESLIQNNLYDNGNDWLYDHLDCYMQWRGEVMAELYEYTMQIGGNGRYIQNSYDNTYLGQLNYELGDGGSVFLVVNKYNRISGRVDMY